MKRRTLRQLRSKLHAEPHHHNVYVEQHDVNIMVMGLRVELGAKLSERPALHSASTRRDFGQKTLEQVSHPAYQLRGRSTQAPVAGARGSNTRSSVYHRVSTSPPPPAAAIDRKS